MFETILIILVCILLLSGLGDFIFKFIGFTAKIVLSVILIAASIYLLFKSIGLLFIVSLLFGIIWLIKTLLFK